MKRRKWLKTRHARFDCLFTKTILQRADLPLRSPELVHSSTTDDLFCDFGQAYAVDILYSSPAPSPAEVNNRHKAEVEVTEYLKEPKIPRNEDIYSYWAAQSSKWPLLSRLARRVHSAPASSAESERVFSAARQIVSDLRERLKAKNAEMLLFLHHNLKHNNFS